MLRLFFTKLWKEEDGLGTLEVLLIIAVLVAVAIVFREWIITWVNELFRSTNADLQETPIQPITPGDI